MKKSIGIFGAFLVMSFSLNASPTHEADSTANIEADDFFCDAGFDAVDAYYDSGGTDGFFAGALFEYICGQ